MDKKKCVQCGYVSEEETIEKCPTCGGDMAEEVSAVNEEIVAEAAEETVELNDTANIVEGLENSEEAAPKANKSLKIVCVVLAVLLVLVAGAFYFVKSNEGVVIDVSSFELSDLSGKFSCENQGFYLDFDPTEITKDVTVMEESADPAEAASSDGEMLSDGTVASDAQPEFKIETRTFDGSYVKGYTDEAIAKSLAWQYIMSNNLTEEYQTFLEENDISGDGIDKYITAKGITQEEIDSANGAEETRKDMEANSSKGHFDYDDATKEIIIYSDNGQELSRMYVTDSGLVEQSDYFRGKVKKDRTFDSVLTHRSEQYGATYTLHIYKDGNYIMNVDVDEQGKQQPFTGTYMVKDGSFIVDESAIFTILNDGIAPYVYVK